MKKSILPILLLAAFFQVNSQNTPKSFRVSGNLGISTEFYDFNATDSSLLPRRPDFNYRLFLNPTFHFGKKISIPLSLMATKRFNSAYLPLPTYENPLQHLTNPNNAIGISPTFGWATFHFGSHTPDFSELSTGNLPIFGAGFDLKPGVWRFAYSQGYTNWALQPDTTLNLQGSYRRKFQAMKLGIGTEGSLLSINTTKISDEYGSLDNPPTSFKPQEGALGTVRADMELTNHITANVEFGFCAFTKDRNDLPIENSRLDFVPDMFFVANQSTRLDKAHIMALRFDYKHWGLSFQQKKIGAGYVPLGFGFVESDILDRTVSPRLQLFNNRFVLNASGGLRRDNLSETKLATTERVILSGNVMVQPFKPLTITANYANYGGRNNIDNDTLRIEYVSKNLSVTPVLRIAPSTKSVHTISATYALSDFNDKNLFTGEFAANQTETWSGSYLLAIGSFSFNASGTFMHNDRSTGALDVTTFTASPGYAFLKKKLNASLGFVYAIIAQQGYTDSKRFLVRPKLRWRLTPKTTFNLTGSLHTYRYGTIRNNAMYDESFLQTGITQSF